MKTTLTENTAFFSVPDMTLLKKIEEIYGVILRNLTNFHDDIGLQVTARGSTVAIGIIVNRGDYGRVVGKLGTHISAQSSILKRICDRYGLLNTIDLREPVVGIKVPQKEFIANKDYKSEPLRALLREVVTLCFEFEVEYIETESDCSTHVEIRVVNKSDHDELEKLSYSLATLWRAMGSRNGHTFNVAVSKPTAPNAATIKV